jgi:hypothetical protein
MITLYNVAVSPPEQIGPLIEENETNLKFAQEAIQANSLQNMVCWLVYINLK